MSFQGDHDLLVAALARARADEVREIRKAVSHEQVLAIFGEAEGGKTNTIRQALAASEAHAASLLAAEMASALAPGLDLKGLAHGGRPPAAVDQARSRLIETLGGGLQEALRPWPSGRYRWAAALESLELLAQAQDLLLWVDHLEVPGLSFRHPLSLEGLLWSLAELVERTG